MPPDAERPLPDAVAPRIPEPAVRPDPAQTLEALSHPDLREDAQARLEREDLDRRRRKEEITSLVQDREQRLVIGRRLFRLVIVWLVFVSTTLVLVAIRWPLNFILSDTVLVALLGTTTVSVVGLLATVALYLFPKR